METCLTEDGSVRKSSLKTNCSSSRGTPPQGATVIVDYVGRLVSEGDTGEGSKVPVVFDSTRDRGEFFRFTLGKEHTIPGLELAVSAMNEGETALITIEPSQAYGPVGNQQGFHGCGRPIPPNATLQFELQLLDWFQDEESDTLTYTCRLEMAEALKSEGNSLFSKHNEVTRAIYKYKRAITVLEDGAYDASPEAAAEERKKQLTITSACNLNLAACQLKQSRYSEAAESCRRVLHHDNNSVKARFRLGRALAGMEEYEQAKIELEKALAQEDLAEVRKELKLVEQKRKLQQKKQQKFYGQLFTKLADDSQGSSGLYTQEDFDAAKKPKMQKCRLCDEEVEEVQLARHVIKKHGDRAS